MALTSGLTSAAHWKRVSFRRSHFWLILRGFIFAVVVLETESIVIFFQVEGTGAHACHEL